MNNSLTNNRAMYFIVTTVIVVCLATITSNALTPSQTTSTDLRNKIAKNWRYSSRGYAEQNCLAYALGKGNVWVWPWGSSNPTKSQSQDYLKSQGYKNFYNSVPPLAAPFVVAYAKNGRITHFLKVTKSGSGSFAYYAKWGKCEIFSHNGYDPYTNYAYGSLSYAAKK
jgi:hypothetical protein